ncbi:hypothetical protein [Pseudobacteroides cellulosolvens]|uniref:Uncharacterized protein n=1 Tax=Pseudobacteroides cellulosolvens ATCC 35603 = DSM 2933 TaxID=398512 RepID=A0A0L6JI15_9FIRM|nr:hypothetical protein [Pseudobacteroides cellulosolvens]KNY25496.1 hypothetical protein Bccel_0756 [Pseudobacteroides cellulosolvens ATCC 35603 = DSM 2933]
MSPFKFEYELAVKHARNKLDREYAQMFDNLIIQLSIEALIKTDITQQYYFFEDDGFYIDHGAEITVEEAMEEAKVH